MKKVKQPDFEKCKSLNKIQYNHGGIPTIQVGMKVAVKYEGKEVYLEVKERVWENEDAFIASVEGFESSEKKYKDLCIGCKVMFFKDDIFSISQSNSLP